MLEHGLIVEQGTHAELLASQGLIRATVGGLARVDFPAMVRGILIGLVVALTLTAAPAHARERAPGAPGGKADWTSADKQGFGTAASREGAGSGSRCATRNMTEVHYPDLSHPSARHLAFMVDGKRVNQRKRSATTR